MMNNGGLIMLLKAMGFDPIEFQTKASEIETQVRAFVGKLLAQQQEANARMIRIEAMLSAILARQNSSTDPAGENSTDFFAQPQLAAAPTQSKQETPHGRNTGNSRTAGRTRKAS